MEVVPLAGSTVGSSTMSGRCGIGIVIGICGGVPLGLCGGVPLGFPRGVPVEVVPLAGSTGGASTGHADWLDRGE